MCHGKAKLLQTKIAVTVNINLARFIGGCNGGESIECSLHSWAVWIGRKVTSGHYVSYVRDGANTVTLFNEKTVKYLATSPQR